MKHGTRYGYMKGCRCDPCRLAHNTYIRNQQRARYQRTTVDAGPWIRVLGLLYRHGYALSDVVKVTGVSHQTVHALAMGERQRVSKVNDAKLRRVFLMLPTMRNVLQTEGIGL